MKGLYNGTLPFGYQRVPKIEGGVPILHPTNVEGYRLAVRLGAQGYTIREIVQQLNAAGYRTTGNWGSRPFSQDTVLPMLKNRFYLGEVSYKGAWMKGKHPAAIDRETWELCRQKIRRRATRRETTKTTDRVYWLRTLLYCATCGRPLRGQNWRGERRYRDPAPSYGEDCTEPQSISAERLENQIKAYLRGIHLPKNWRTEAMHYLGEDGELAHSARMRQELQDKLDRAKRLYLLGDLTERMYLAERTQIQNVLATLHPTRLPDVERTARVAAVERGGKDVGRVDAR